MNGWQLGCNGAHWNGNIDFAKMSDAGAIFYIGKATDSFRGGSAMFEDILFDYHFRTAFSIGKLLLGGYHWLQPDIDPYKAADFYLERYFRFPFHFPPVLDFEETYAYRKLISVDPKVYEPTHLESHYAWCAQVWLDRVEAQTGRLPIVYTAKWFTDNFQQKHLGFLKKYPLWVAQYPRWMTFLSRPSLPYPWENWDYWQWSEDNNSRGAEFGAQGASMGLNYFQGSYEKLLVRLNTNEPTPINPQLPEGTMFVIEMLGNMTIRSGPSLTSLKTGEFARTGETYHATQEKNGWYYIGRGWISGTTQWTRITEVSEPIPPEIPPDSVEARLTTLEADVAKLKEYHQ